MYIITFFFILSWSFFYKTIRFVQFPSHWYFSSTYLNPPIGKHFFILWEDFVSFVKNLEERKTKKYKRKKWKNYFNLFFHKKKFEGKKIYMEFTLYDNKINL